MCIRDRFKRGRTSTEDDPSSATTSDIILKKFHTQFSPAMRVGDIADTAGISQERVYQLKNLV